MHITKVSVKGFKSLADFELELAPFTCLIGLNGCGKSTVLQFFDFISHVLTGDVEKWFDAREWEPGEEATSSGASEIGFRIEFSNSAAWEGSYEIETRICRLESISTPSSCFSIEGDALTMRGLQPGGLEAIKEMTFALPLDKIQYSGSVTSILRDESLPPEIAELKGFIRSLRMFDTLAPQFLRRRGRATRDSIGHYGEDLAAYFDSMSEENRTNVVDTLVDFYPHLSQLQHVFTRHVPGELKELVVHEAYGTNSHQITRSRHINDGLLRLIAILSELRSEHSFLLFDEIENGINPELVEALLQKLTTSPHQVLVTTHSPMILNYLDDDLARQSVVFLYKGPDGATRSRRFFDIPSISEKLEVMGPGEAFVDTNLVALTEELNAAVAGA